MPPPARSFVLPGDRSLPLLRTSAAGLHVLARAGRLGTTMATQMAHQMNRSASAAEVRSWDGSLAALAADLHQAGLGGVEVLAEYQLPLSSKRVDVVLAGEHPRRGGPSYVVVELKQWTQASLFEDEPELVLQPTYGPRPVLHPVAQVRGYVEYLLDFLGVLHGTTDVLAGAAYLHNATDDRVAALRGYPQDEYGRFFTGQGRLHGLPPEPPLLHQRVDPRRPAAPLLRGTEQATPRRRRGGTSHPGTVRPAGRAEGRLRPRPA